jgi:hypothetical protein
MLFKMLNVLKAEIVPGSDDIAEINEKKTFYL